MMAGSFHKLRVHKTRSEIGGAAKTVEFNVPPDSGDAFRWLPGQHLTIRLRMQGREVRRSYSISASPFGNQPLRITVKRVEGGLVSNHINNEVEAGDLIDVMPPYGTFRLEPRASMRRTYYLFAAGSGITPLFAMLCAVLEAEPHSVVRLLYGNAGTGTIIFGSELEQLLMRHPGRLAVTHTLSKPPMRGGGRYRKGIVDAAAVKAFIESHPPYAQDTQYYICGPGTMNGSVKQALMDLDAPASRIHAESYGAAVEEMPVTGIPATAKVTLDGAVRQVQIAEGQTLLEAAKAAGLEPPYSCEAGACGACRAHLTSGRADMKMRMALEDHEIERGAILTCQAVAATPNLELNYD